MVAAHPAIPERPVGGFREGSGIQPEAVSGVVRRAGAGIADAIGTRERSSSARVIHRIDLNRGAGLGGNDGIYLPSTYEVIDGSFAVQHSLTVPERQLIS